MKHGQRPTRRQKQAITAAKLDPADWLVVKSLPQQLHIVHRNDGTAKIIAV
jgi:hypothetical protein